PRVRGHEDARGCLRQPFSVRTDAEARAVRPEVPHAGGRHHEPPRPPRRLGRGARSSSDRGPDPPPRVAAARAGGRPGEAACEGRSSIVSAARETMLERIRESLRDVPKEERPEDVTIDRSYRSVDPSPRAELVEHFIDRVSEYKAAVRKV